MPVRVHGLAPREGDTAFAFLVLRLAAPVDRAGLVDLLHQIAPLVRDAEGFAALLPDDGDEAMRLVGIPWSPPEVGHALDAQRRLIEGAALHGIAEAWFFQTGTSLPAVCDDDGDGGAGGEHDHGGGDSEGDGGDDDAAGDDDDDDDDDAWSHGPPPQASQVRFPVDGYPEILDELDWEDFGIAFKLGGPWTAGERMVLIGFHAMWLAPYGGRYRNAAVTIDQRHHAAHLWVDRFAVSSSAREQVHHLLWVVSKLDEVMPVVHARFGGAMLAQKYGDNMAETREPFVLGGNPLNAVHTLGGERGVDAWIAAQTVWSSEEVAQMLRELAIDLATGRTPSDDRGEADDGEGSGDELDIDAVFEATGMGRCLTAYAGELLTERARAGSLDRRVAGLLRPVLGAARADERRRIAAVSVLGAVRDRDSVPAMIRIVEDAPIARGLGSIGKRDLLAATVNALGEIADPAAIPALARRILIPGAYGDEPRAALARALAACVTAAPALEPAIEPPGPELDDALFDALARSIGETSDDVVVAELHLAYGALAGKLPPARREAAHARLRELAVELDGGTGAARLARGAVRVRAPVRVDDAPLAAEAPASGGGAVAADRDDDSVN